MSLLAQACFLQWQPEQLWRQSNPECWGDSVCLSVWEISHRAKNSYCGLIYISLPPLFSLMMHVVYFGLVLSDQVSCFFFWRGFGSSSSATSAFFHLMWTEYMHQSGLNSDAVMMINVYHFNTFQHFTTQSHSNSNVFTRCLICTNSYDLIRTNSYVFC